MKADYLSNSIKDRLEAYRKNKGPGNGFVEWDEDDSPLALFRHWFPAGDPVWQFIKVA